MSSRKRAATTRRVAADHPRHAAPALSPGSLFAKSFQAWQRAVRARLDAHGITLAQHSVLAAASHLSAAGDAVRQRDIVDRLLMDKMTVSDVVRSLESSGWLSRRRSEHDGRAVALHVTSRGRDLLAAATVDVDAADREFFAVLTAAQRRSFLAALHALEPAR